MSTGTTADEFWPVELDLFPARRIIEWLAAIVGMAVAWGRDAPTLVYLVIGAVLLSINLIYGLRLMEAARYRFSDDEVIHQDCALRWENVKSGTHDTYFGVFTLVPKEGDPLAIPITAYKNSGQLLRRIEQKLKARFVVDRSGEILDHINR